LIFLSRDGFGSLRRIIWSIAELAEAPVALWNLSTISRDSGESVIVVLRSACFWRPAPTPLPACKARRLAAGDEVGGLIGLL
jgi:hypothetical protein